MCLTDAANADCDKECLSAVRFLLLSADATVNTTASDTSATTVMSCSIVPYNMVHHCLLPLADVLLLAGSHVYLSAIKLHRALMMMVALSDELSTSEGQIFAVGLS